METGQNKEIKIRGIVNGNRFPHEYSEDIEN